MSTLTREALTAMLTPGFPPGPAREIFEAGCLAAGVPVQDAYTPDEVERISFAVLDLTTAYLEAQLGSLATDS